jgi:hypothetical protein
MVARVREKLVSEGLDAVLTRKKRETPPIEPKFDGSAKRSSAHWPTRNRRPAMPGGRRGQSLVCLFSPLMRLRLVAA